MKVITPFECLTLIFLKKKRKKKKKRNPSDGDHVLAGSLVSRRGPDGADCSTDFWTSHFSLTVAAIHTFVPLARDVRELDSSTYEPTRASPRVSSQSVRPKSSSSSCHRCSAFTGVPRASQPRRITVSCTAGMRRYICCRLLWNN